MTKAEISSKRDRKRPMHSGKRWKASWGWEGLAADHARGAASPSCLPSWAAQSGSRMRSGLCPRKEVPPPGSEEELTLGHRGQQQLWEAVPDHPGLKSPTQYTRPPTAPKLLSWPHGRHSRLTNILAPCLNGNKASSWSPSREGPAQASSKTETDKDSPLWPHGPFRKTPTDSKALSGSYSCQETVKITSDVVRHRLKITVFQISYGCFCTVSGNPLKLIFLSHINLKKDK